MSVFGESKSEKLPIGSEEWAKQMNRETKSLARNIDENYLRLAKNLWELFDRPVNNDPKMPGWVQKWGYGLIGDYAEKELGISRRIGERLRRIWLIAGVECALSDENMERFIKIGRSKARLLTQNGVMSKDTATEWITRAEGVSYAELEKVVLAHLHGRSNVMKGTLGKIERLDANGEVVEEDDDLPAPIFGAPQKSMEQLVQGAAASAVYGTSLAPEEKPLYKNFALFPDQYDTMTAALERAGELSGSKKDGQNLSLICLDFLATNEFKKASLEQTQRFLKRIEKVLGLKILAMSETSYEILYGYKTLERLMSETKEAPAIPELHAAVPATPPEPAMDEAEAATETIQ